MKIIKIQLYYKPCSSYSFNNNKWKKSVAYPQEDFLFIKLMSCFRFNLLNNCKKDFRFQIKTPLSILFTLNIKFMIYMVGYKTYLNLTFLSFHDSQLYFKPHKVHFFELSTTYKNVMTNKFRFWAPMPFDWTL
jgi:hypothetical protein